MSRKSDGVVIPEPDAGLVTRTLLNSLGVKPDSRITCEHGCSHSAHEFVLAHLQQLIRQAQISVANTIGVTVEGIN
jgi:hypothetical protein